MLSFVHISSGHGRYSTLPSEVKDKTKLLRKNTPPPRLNAIKSQTLKSYRTLSTLSILMHSYSSRLCKKSSCRACEWTLTFNLAAHFRYAQSWPLPSTYSWHWLFKSGSVGFFCFVDFPFKYQTLSNTCCRVTFLKHHAAAAQLRVGACCVFLVRLP